MKKLYTIVMVFASALCLTALTNSCSDEAKLIEELDLANVLTPTSTEAVISNTDGCTTTFTWASSSAATEYVIEIYRWDSESAPKEVTDAELSSGYKTEYMVEQSSSSKISYVEVLEPDYSYYARVKGCNPDKGDSHWAVFRYPIEPYRIMELVASFEITERTTESISVAWTIAEDDEAGINQIRLSPNPDDPDSSYKIFYINQEDGEYKVEGLTASTQYTISVNYGTTARGTIVTWTMPNTEGATEVESTDGLKAAINDGATKIVVKYSEDPYEIGEFTVTSSAETLEIYGEGTAAGAMPTIKGILNIGDASSLTSLHLEALAFDGDNYTYNHIINFTASLTFSDISVLNCTLNQYKRGLIYAGSSCNVSIDALSFTSVYVTDTNGDGGEAIGFRGAGTIGTLSITNSTFDEGMRELLRIDDTNTIGTFTFEHNTVNSITTFASSSGIFYIRAAITDECSVCYNLFMNLAGSTAHGSSGKYVIGAAAFSPTKSTKNYWYNIGNYADEGDNFFTTGYTLSAATSGGAVLTSDPCYDSSKGNLYVTSSTVINANAGDPRWFADYIPEPEPELEVVTEEYEWDLTDGETFYGTLDQSTTRGNLRFLINGTTIRFEDEGFYFTGKSSLITSTGIPTDGAIAFLVNKPGSVVVSTSGNNNVNLSVASAVYDANDDYLATTKTSVAGSVPSNVEKEYIAALDIDESGDKTYVVYLYATDAIYLTSLKWMPMTVQSGVAKLPTPTNLKVSPEVADETVSSVTLSWDGCANATYTVYLDGTEAASGLTETTCEISITSIEADNAEHELTVKANYTGTLDRSDSDISAPVTFTKKSSWTAVPSTETTTWGSDVWEDISTTHGTVSGGTWLYTDNMLFIDGTSKDFTFASDSYGYYTKIGGSGSDTQDNIQFKVKTNGTFSFTTLSGNADENSRYAKVYVDGVQSQSGKYEDGTSITDGKFYCPGNTNAPGTYTVEVSGISGETVIAITSGSGGICFYELSWTPAENDGSAPEGCVPTNVVTEWASTAFEWLYENVANKSSDAIKDNDFTTQDELLTFVQGGGSGFKFASGSLDAETTGYRFQFGGSGSTTKCCVTFNVSTTGTLKFNIISGSSSDDRYLNVTVGSTEYKGETEGFKAEANSGKYPTEYSLSVNSVSGSTPIYLYSANSGINVFGIKWVPEGVKDE